MVLFFSHIWIFKICRTTHDISTTSSLKSIKMYWFFNKLMQISGTGTFCMNFRSRLPSWLPFCRQYFSRFPLPVAVLIFVLTTIFFVIAAYRNTPEPPPLKVVSSLVLGWSTMICCQIYCFLLSMLTSKGIWNLNYDMFLTLLNKFKSCSSFLALRSYKLSSYIKSVGISRCKISTPKSWCTWKIASLADRSAQIRFKGKRVRHIRLRHFRVFWKF